MDNAFPLPMFPLSSVMFPFTGIPLHVFEIRYRQLVADLSTSPPYFGIILITRGSEIGGGDDRASVGTMARMSEKVELADGRWVILSVGETKIRVTRWLPDDPYPLALVERIDEVPKEVEQPGQLGMLEKKLRYCLLLQGEMSLASTVSPNTVLSPRPEEALWQMCALAPVPVIDQQRLLEEENAPLRAVRLDQLLTDKISILESQLST